MNLYQADPRGHVSGKWGGGEVGPRGCGFGAGEGGGGGAGPRAMLQVLP